MNIGSLFMSFIMCFSLMGNSMYSTMPDKDVNSNSFLVNKTAKISYRYIPEIKKTKVFGESKELSKEASDQIVKMFDAAKKDGYKLFLKSSYRSHSKQQTIFARKLNYTKGDENLASETVTYPGASEHQLGLAADVATSKALLSANFSNTKEGKWLADNSYKFGYIVRYPENFSNITDISYEPWHLRYVGEEIAKEIYDNNMVLETYVSKKRLENYKKLLSVD